MIWTYRGRTFHHRLWYGPKKLSRFWFDARTLKEMEFYSSIKVGDLVQDCDYFNHRVTKVEPRYRHVWEWRGQPISKRNRRAQFLWEFDVRKEDDLYFCHVDTPWPRENIEKALLSCFDYNEKSDWFKDDRSMRLHQALRDGRHVCDENGVRLPEFDPEPVALPGGV